MLLVVGIDPSLRCTGITALAFPGPKLVATAEVNGVPLVNLSDRERADTIVAQIRRFIETVEGMGVPVELVGIETPVMNRNAKVYGRLVRLGEAIERGVARPIMQVTPSEVKLALAGRGNATKDQMVRAAEDEFRVNLPGNKAGKEARADAIGVALAAYARFRDTGRSP